MLSHAHLLKRVFGLILLVGAAYMSILKRVFGLILLVAYMLFVSMGFVKCGPTGTAITCDQPWTVSEFLTGFAVLPYFVLTAAFTLLGGDEVTFGAAFYLFSFIFWSVFVVLFIYLFGLRKR